MNSTWPKIIVESKEREYATTNRKKKTTAAALTLNAGIQGQHGDPDCSLDAAVPESWLSPQSTDGQERRKASERPGKTRTNVCDSAMYIYVL